MCGSDFCAQCLGTGVFLVAARSVCDSVYVYVGLPPLAATAERSIMLGPPGVGSRPVGLRAVPRVVRAAEELQLGRQ